MTNFVSDCILQPLQICCWGVSHIIPSASQWLCRQSGCRPSPKRRCPRRSRSQVFQDARSHGGSRRTGEVSDQPKQTLAEGLYSAEATTSRAQGGCAHSTHYDQCLPLHDRYLRAHCNSQTRDYFAHTGTIQYRVSTRVSITATRVTTLRTLDCTHPYCLNVSTPRHTLCTNITAHAVQSHMQSLQL
eukprot:SAG25_NODE_1523_length_2848_cov_1.759913_4_plen_187_part_00